jgi:membrane associated rhomboid family serine protease
LAFFTTFTRILQGIVTEKRKFIHSLIFPLFFSITLWLFKLFEYISGSSLVFLGIYPRKISGLTGIIAAPLIHSGISHLLNNTVPLIILSVAIFYFYRPLGYKVFFLTWIMTGIWVWCGGREAYHIGASGIVYGLAFFLFFSGTFRRIPELAAVSLVVVFLYGSMIWGIFPFVPDISWESHLSGGIAGLILSILYRNEGPQPRKYDLEDLPIDAINSDNTDITSQNIESGNSDNIRYLYKKNEEEKAGDT